jgi:hypothetical protein
LLIIQNLLESKYGLFPYFVQFPFYAIRLA